MVKKLVEYIICMSKVFARESFLFAVEIEVSSNSCYGKKRLLLPSLPQLLNASHTKKKLKYPSLSSIHI